MVSTNIIIALLLSYLLGSIPFGLLLTKIFAKKDVRKTGSGNIGATNVLRTAGKKLGYATFILDGLKAVIAVRIAMLFGITGILPLNLIALFAIIGHIFPIWLRFKGGKGFATFVGVLFCYDIVFAIFFILGWYVVFYITRIVSIASVMLSFVMIVYFTIQWDISYISLIIAAMLIIYKHRDNIKRVIAGEENSFKS